jgi:hypothetical protein
LKRLALALVPIEGARDLCKVETWGEPVFVILEPPPPVFGSLESVVEAVFRPATHFEGEWVQRSVPQSDVGNERALEVDEQDHVIPDRRLADHIPNDGASDAIYPKADLAERGGEQAIHLVAPAAAALSDESLFEMVFVEALGLIELDVEVFVGDMSEVGLVQRDESRFVYVRGAVEADPFEIGVQVQGWLSGPGKGAQVEGASDPVAP